MESRHSSAFQMDWRQDGYHKLMFFVDGRGKLQLRGRDCPVSAPALALVPKAVPHRLCDAEGDPLTVYLLCLREAGFNSFGLLHACFRKPEVVLGNRVVHEALPRLQRMLFERWKMEDGADELVAALATELLVMLLRRPRAETVGGEGAEARVRRYGSELRGRFWASESMDDIARRLGLSRRTFSSLFRRIHGRSWLQEVHSERIKHAEMLLTTSNLPVKAVAFECGYRDVSHFYRWFVVRTGLTPLQCRQAKT